MAAEVLCPHERPAEPTMSRDRTPLAILGVAKHSSARVQHRRQPRLRQGQAMRSARTRRRSPQRGATQSLLAMRGRPSLASRSISFFQDLLFFRTEHRHQPLFLLVDQRRGGLVDLAPGRRQRQHRAAAVVAVGLAADEAALQQARHGAADRHLVHRRAVGDLTGRRTRVQRQNRDHPPFGNRHAVTIPVYLGDVAADTVGQHAQAIRQELLKVEQHGLLRRMGARSFMLHCVLIFGFICNYKRRVACAFSRVFC